MCVAFLYAPQDEIREGRPVALKPPHLLIRLGYLTEEDYFLALRLCTGFGSHLGVGEPTEMAGSG